MPRRYQYRTRACTQCGEAFVPTGPRSERCQPCRVERAVRRVIVGFEPQHAAREGATR